MPMERLHIMVPKGTIKRAKKAAKQVKMDTHSEWIRAVVKTGLDAVEVGKK